MRLLCGVAEDGDVGGDTALEEHAVLGNAASVSPLRLGCALPIEVEPHPVCGPAPADTIRGDEALGREPVERTDEGIAINSGPGLAPLAVNLRPALSRRQELQQVVVPDEVAVVREVSAVQVHGLLNEDEQGDKNPHVRLGDGAPARLAAPPSDDTRGRHDGVEETGS